MEQTKTCRECGRTLPLEDFPPRKDQPDGYHWWCLECKRAKVREYGRTYRARHPEEIKRSNRRYSRKADVREKRADESLLAKYGLTPESFQAKLDSQGGRCPFCPEDVPGPVDWHVDHDHDHCPGQNTCGKCLRDILCRRHNMGLGYFNDDPELLRAAADYIEQHRERIRAEAAEPWSPRGIASGERHVAWKGDQATKGGFQLRVVRARGKADRCINGCVKDRYEWVPAKGADPSDPANYLPMCRSCSIVHYGQNGAGHVRALLTDEQVREMRARYSAGGVTQKELAAEFGVSQPTVSCVIRGEKYKAA